MQDNPLITLIISLILASETAMGIPGTPLQQAFQPTQQGTNSDPTAFLHKLHDVKVGSPFRKDFWDEDNQQMVHTQQQLYETTLQASALSIQDPANQSQLTASDILNLVSAILQDEQTILAFQAQNIGILKVNDVTNGYFLDDFGRYEAGPTFDFKISHTQTIVTTGPYITEVELKVLPV